MLDLTNPSVIRALLSRHGIRPKKALGQNFLTNPSVCPRMAREGGARPGVCALEIGPGVGVLTAELAKVCDQVVAVELDKGLIPVLSETLRGFDNVTILQGDILEMNPAALLWEQFGGHPSVVCANLPYYITTPILMHILEGDCRSAGLESITVMVQKETGQRICAPLPSRQAGAITAAIAWRTIPEILFEVSRGSFLPPPEVESSVIRLTLRDQPPALVREEELLFQAVRSAFAQRRKTILNGLSAGLGLPKEEMARRLEAAGVSPSSRAEQLSLEEFARIADQL